MKKQLLILICLFVSFEVNSELRWKGELGQKLLEFNYIDGLYYKKFSDIPFTGKIVGLLEGTFKKGMKHGEFIKYYSDGKILSKINYFENILDGDWIEYYRNGNLLMLNTNGNLYSVNFISNKVINWVRNFNTEDQVVFNAMPLLTYNDKILINTDNNI